MKTINVQASKSYDIFIGNGILKDVGTIIRKNIVGGTAAVITDDIVNTLYGEQLIKALENSGYRTIRHVFPNGEASKNAETFLSILNFLADKKLTRTDTVVALGGGVTGDLAGFTSACYMRGINFVQIPTTLLAAVDSSVGGKTGINLNAGKNLAGAFYQPNAVICDVSLLSTLSEDILRDGIAEVIKYGMIADSQLLTMPIVEHLEDVILRCVKIKRDIVMEDEFEGGLRKVLNFGHTVGHAIEKLSEYKISHGYAVAAGMAIITRAANRIGLCDRECLQTLLDCLELYGLPCSTEYNAIYLADICLSDKKRDGDSLTMIFPKVVGKCILSKIPIYELKSVIQKGLIM